jgi:hypothetical protein
VRVYDFQNDYWRTSMPGSDITVNENYPIWGKPIHAMADGVVVQFLDGQPANTPPNLPSPTPDPVEGNHFYIQHGDDLALYAHFISGTLNSELTSGPNADGTGAAVTEGQLLGLAGNSGNSSEPHLHIHINRATIPWGGPARPLTFKDMNVVDLGAIDQNANVWPPEEEGAPWYKVSGQALPSVLSAIWPGTLKSGKYGGGGYRWGKALAWAWIILIGGLMITPGGVSCTVCGWGLTMLMGIASVVLGAYGLVSSLRGRTTVAQPRVTSSQVNAKGDMHT